MRIISKFDDFYDYNCQFICSKELVYERNLNDSKFISKKETSKWKNYSFKNSVSKVEINNEVLDKLNKTFNFYLQDRDSNFSIIIIGEKVIPFITRVSGSYNDYKYEFLYENELENMTKKEQTFMKRNFNDLYNKVREITKAPIVSYSIFEDSFLEPEPIRMRRGANFNSILSKLKLQNFIEGFLLLQEIEMYLNKEKYSEKEVKFSNEIKIKNAGFDKNSFKRRKK